MGDYFKSEKDKLVFLLLEVDGRRRNELLGITAEMYENKTLAKEWYAKLATQLSCDAAGEVAQARKKLEEIYQIMIS